MKMAMKGWSGSLRAAAVIVTLLLVSAAASAHGTGDRVRLASDCVQATQGGVVLDPDCMFPASGHSLHCHLTSVPSMAAGPYQPLDDDQPAAVAPAVRFLALRYLRTYPAPASPIPIAALPRFILFGNFRS